MATTLEPLSPEDTATVGWIAHGKDTAWLFPGYSASYRDAIIHIVKGVGSVTLCGLDRPFAAQNTISAQLWESRTLNTTLCRRCVAKTGDPSITARFEAQRQIVAAHDFVVPANTDAASKASGILRNLRKRADLDRALASLQNEPDAADWCEAARWASQVMESATAICNEILTAGMNYTSFVTHAASKVVAADAIKAPLVDGMDLKAFISDNGHSYGGRQQKLPGFVELWRGATASGSGENPVELWMVTAPFHNIEQLTSVPALIPLANETAAQAGERSWRAHIEGQLHTFVARLDDAYRDLIDLDQEPTVRLRVTKPAELDHSSWAPMLTRYPTSKGPRNRTEWSLPAVCAAMLVQEDKLACTVVGYEPTDAYTTVALKLWEPGNLGPEGLLSSAARLARVVT